MSRKKFPLLLYLIIGLAVIGLFASLIRNPGSFLMNILIMIGIGFVVFLIFSAIVNRRSSGKNNNEMKKYRKAAKQSNIKYNKQQPKVRKSMRTDSPIRPKKRRRHVTHLTVIDGKKTNNNDRASN